MRLERRKVHFPDSLAAKVLDLIYVSPNRIPCRDLDLETELPGERQPSGHHLLAWTVAETAQFCSQRLLSSGCLPMGATFLVIADVMNLAAGSCSWKFSRVGSSSPCSHFAKPLGTW